MSDARILERGYRRYDGPRLGVRAAQASLARHTLQRVLGLRRPARSKALPFLSVAIAYLPAVTFVGVVALLPRQLWTFLPGYGQYYGFVSAAIVLFVVFAAPEALCPDRRTRLLSLYLASPLTRASYLVAKAAAVGAALCLVTVGPLLVLLLGRALQGAGPDGPLAFAGLLARIVGAGAVLAAVYTAVSLAVSSLTDRRAIASGAMLLLFVGSGLAAAILVAALDAPLWMSLLSVNRSAFELAQRIHGARGGAPELSTAAVAAANLAWATGAAALAWWRYRVLRVTR